MKAPIVKSNYKRAIEGRLVPLVLPAHRVKKTPLLMGESLRISYDHRQNMSGSKNTFPQDSGSHDKYIDVVITNFLALATPTNNVYNHALEPFSLYNKATL